jgi:hypothetical protein
MVTSTARTNGIKYALILPNYIVGADAPLMVEYAVAAEEAGWDGVFPYDILIMPPPSSAAGQAADPEGGWNPADYRPFIDPWITLAAVASRTTRVKLGTWITPLARRQPWQVARDLATLDRLSNGRVILGTGLGRRPDYEKFGIAWDARAIARRYDEALELIGRFWSGERVTYHGEHFDVDDVALLPTPVQQPRIPILIAGFWPNRKPFQRGARWDGIMPYFGLGADQGVPPETLVENMLRYYHSLTDDPGDIFLPLNPRGRSSEYVDICAELGATWLYVEPPEDRHGDAMIEWIRQGPQRE